VLTWIPLVGPPAPDHLGDITFRLATAADLERLEDFEAYGHGSRQRRYVDEDRDWLLVACRLHGLARVHGVGGDDRAAQHRLGSHARGRNARHGFVSYTRLLFYERLRVSDTLPRRLEEALDRARGRTTPGSPVPRAGRRA